MISPNKEPSEEILLKKMHMLTIFQLTQDSFNLISSNQMKGLSFQQFKKKINNIKYKKINIFK